ncbi:MAG: hypothetical protein GAK34_02128 [Delftia tsuruhatensis]|nr:MAG: hypothetical protein GAK34_02128 [Delftia tsuruhatensis]
MPLLLRLFFIRRSKNNQRRSHAGKPRQPGLPKKQTRELGWSQASAKKDCAPAKLARLSAKNPQDSWAMALLMKTRRHPSPGWHAGERRPFSRQAVNNQGKLRGNGVSRTGTCGHARGRRCSFKKIQSLIWALQAACASESGAADPALARAITKSDGCSTAGRKDGNQAVSPTARRQRKHQQRHQRPVTAGLCKTIAPTCQQIDPEGVNGIDAQSGLAQVIDPGRHPVRGKAKCQQENAEGQHHRKRAAIAVEEHEGPLLERRVKQCHTPCHARNRQDHAQPQLP